MERPALLLDACVAINLVATDRLNDIAALLETTFILARRAADEVGQLREEIGDELVVTPIDLDKYPGDTLSIVDLRSEEYPLYVDLAALVDDGEAATITIARHRGTPMATDDRKARRVCREYGIPQPQRTLAILRAYAEAALLSHNQTRDLLLRVRRRASFLPPKSDPDCSWWVGHVHDDG